MGKQRFSLFRAFFFLLALAGTASLFPELQAAEPSPPARQTKSASPEAVTAPELAREASERMMRVPEFEFIRQEAEKLGVKVYLFGGTAASYAHYVKEDMLRERGDTRYPADRFDYDYTNIFRSTQDLDVVIDGTGEQAAALEATLKRKFPHFVGDKAAQWEVRPLREARGDKEALLNNADFQNQHTDSHSTGLVEVTKPSPGESAVRDVRDWNAKEPTFLRDVSKSEIHYYFSPSHGETTRARRGLNPPILSAIRYLTKAFQYNLEIPAEDLAKIREIVAAYDPKAPLDQYVKNWIEKNGKKLFLHSVNLEKSWNMLEELGLRRKLIAVKNNPGEVDSLAWWMNKEPLRTQAVGQGSGKTAAAIAKERGVDKITLAHETNSFLAYESITRSKAGDLNALISRQNMNGEAAAAGDGFYTAYGTSGAKGTGLTIRMELDPKAREGTDFIRGAEGHYFVLRNRAAVRVIPESIQLSLLEYFKQLGEGKSFSKDDRALLEAFRRKTKKNLTMDPAEKKELFEYIEQAMAHPKGGSGPLWEEWFKHPLSTERPELMKAALTNTTGNAWQDAHNRGPALQAIRTRHWRENPMLLDFVTNDLNRNPALTPQILLMAAETPSLQAHPNFFKWAKRAWELQPSADGHSSEVMNALVPVLYEKGRMEEFLEHLFKVGHPDSFSRNYAISEILGEPKAETLKNFAKMVEIALADHPQHAAEAILTKSHAYTHSRFSEWLEKLGSPKNVDKFGYELVAKVISAVPIKFVKSPEKWAERIVQSKMLQARSKGLQAMKHLLIDQQYYRSHPKASAWIDALMRDGIDGAEVYNFMDDLSKKGYPRKDIVAHYIRLLDASKYMPLSHAHLLMPGDGVDPQDYPLVEAYLRYAKRAGGFQMERLVERITQSFLAGKLPSDLFDRWISGVLEDKKHGGHKGVVEKALHLVQVKERPRFGDWVEKALDNHSVHYQMLEGILRYPPEDPAKNKRYWQWMKKIAQLQVTSAGGFALLAHLSRTKGASEHPEVVEALILNEEMHYSFSREFTDLFEKPEWREHPAFQKVLGLKPHERVRFDDVKTAIQKTAIEKNAIQSGKRLNPVTSFVSQAKLRCSQWFGLLRK